MVFKRLIGLVFAGALAFSAGAAEIVVRIAPPHAVIERRGPPPSRNHVWISGYHRWDGNAYAWNAGRWEQPPRPHARWKHITGSTNAAVGYWWKGAGARSAYIGLHMPVHGAAGMWRSNRLGCHGLGPAGMVRFVFSILLLCHAHGLAQSLPQPPCGQDPVPPYPGVERSPIVKFWSRGGVRPRLETSPVHWLDRGGLLDADYYSRAIPLYRGSRGLASPDRGGLGACGNAVLVDHSQAVADIDRGRPRSDRPAAKPPAPGLHARRAD